MPELPEVETVKRTLEPQLTERSILQVELRQPGIIACPDADSFCSALIGRQFAGMGRRSKYLQLFLTDGSVLILHLRMTGQLLVAPPHFPQEKHTHVLFYLDNGMVLQYIDPRRFGRFWLQLPGEKDTTGISRLGPEPFGEAFSGAYLQQRLGKSRKPIKECLLDQHVVAGIGNIYADESLFAAKINPKRPAQSLTSPEWERLAAVIPDVLQKAIDDNAISAENYLEGRGKEYRNTPFFKVYGLAGTPCSVCGHELTRIVLAGRSSCYCPHCQPE